MVATISESARDVASPGTAAPQCLACLATELETKQVTSRAVQRELGVRICQRCGYVEVLDNFHDYTTSTSTEDLGFSPRCGTVETPGREFGMARMGIEVLGRQGLSAMIYGVGRSMDNLHIAKLPEIGRMVIGDIMRIRDDGEFVDTSGDASETFDMVLCCEVIEHFVDPRVDFPKLFGWIGDDGILICSTNMYDGGDLERQRYIYTPGHVSYYTSEALRTIASANGIKVDFRLPWVSIGYAGPRKRYVIFSRSERVMDSVSDYFGRHAYAPSEDPGEITVPGAKQRARAPRTVGA
jgi:hypothetical protein